MLSSLSRWFCSEPPILKAHNYTDIILRLPMGKRIKDIKWLSVWCRRFTVFIMHFFSNILVLFLFVIILWLVVLLHFYNILSFCANLFIVVLLLLLQDCPHAFQVVVRVTFWICFSCFVLHSPLWNYLWSMFLLFCLRWIISLKDFKGIIFPCNKYNAFELYFR